MDSALDSIIKRNLAYPINALEQLGYQVDVETGPIRINVEELQETLPKIKMHSHIEDTEDGEIEVSFDQTISFPTIDTSETDFYDAADFVIESWKDVVSALSMFKSFTIDPSDLDA